MAQHEENLIEFDEPPRFRDIKILSFWSTRPARSHGIVSEQVLPRGWSKESI